MSYNIQVISVRLQRSDNTVSWGFNVQGGKEFHSPLVIQKVNANSLAERSSIRQGDYILRIGNIIAENLTHNQARDAIIRQGNNLELTLQRGSPPRSEDYAIKYDFPPHQLMSNSGANSHYHNNNHQNPLHSSSHLSGSGFESSSVVSPQIGLQLGSNKALLTQSYNSPMGLYSSQNIAEALVTTVKNNPSGGDPPSTLNYQPYHQPLPHYQANRAPPPPAPIHRSVAPTTTSSFSSNLQAGAQPFRNSNLSTSLAGASASSSGGQRNFTRGIKGSALLNNPNTSAAVPTCAACCQLIRGPFISAVGKIWCPNHFVCAQPNCGASLIDVGFVEENGKLYCESDFEKYFAPSCYKCQKTIMGECCYALEKAFHPECFVCGHCKQTIGSGSFHLEDGVPYCIRDFNALFSTKCAGCEFPIEAGDKFLEALNAKYHVECFTCSTCHVPLNSGFATKGNKPYCRKHAY